jgi:hypothetical protein
MESSEEMKAPFLPETLEEGPVNSAGSVPSAGIPRNDLVLNAQAWLDGLDASVACAELSSEQPVSRQEKEVPNMPEACMPAPAVVAAAAARGIGRDGSVTTTTRTCDVEGEAEMVAAGAGRDEDTEFQITTGQKGKKLKKEKKDKKIRKEHQDKKEKQAKKETQDKTEKKVKQSNAAVGLERAAPYQEPFIDGQRLFDDATVSNTSWFLCCTTTTSAGRCSPRAELRNA